jgi:hypothetical protein
MAQTTYTEADKALLGGFKNLMERLRHGIDIGRPYVWELRLSLDDFCQLESAIKNSVSSHGGDYHHLLSEDFAVIVVIYLAEWYKRFYKDADKMDDNKVLTGLTSKELERLYELAHIDKNTFVYNASKNPDKTNYRWLESLQLLGGLAVQAELKRDKTDALLPQLCKIFHGEELNLDDISDHNRAVAFQESISRQHSLYDYLDCILDKAKEPPFAPSDLMNEGTMIPELIKRIEDADKVAKREKFDFEWIITYTAKTNQMVRHLRVKLKPEIIGGGRKQYIGYDRLSQPEWGIDHPEDVGRIELFLRFKNGGHVVARMNEPIFKYDNTGSEKTGFLSVNKIDENTCIDVPPRRIDMVDMVMRYGTAQPRVVQEFPMPDCMQVYALPKSSNRFSSRKNSQTATVVIFSSAYHLADDYNSIPVVYAHYRNGEQSSEDFCWCPVNDKIVLEDQNGKPLLPFFNRNGLYQVVTRKYLKTIKYRDNVFVLYKYIDTEYDDDVMQEDELPVLFGRSGLEVRHFDSGKSTEGTLVTDYSLEWMKNGRYVDWDKEEPEQGYVRLRVTVKGIVFNPRVYYVPFNPATIDQQPIWRDFEHMKICTTLDGVEDIQDTFAPEPPTGKREPSTKVLEIGNDNAQILVDVYRPVILRELSQKKSGDEEAKITGYYGKNEKVEIPLINCGQFSLRDFSETGVREYRIHSENSIYYSFPTLTQPNITTRNFGESKSASELSQELPLDYLKIYIAKAVDNPMNLYAWNYKDEPAPVGSFAEKPNADIIFQSLKDDDSPRHYCLPTIKSDVGDILSILGGGAAGQADALKCFETAAEHKTYFFLFKPLRKCVSEKKQIKDILIPLMLKRNYQLSDADVDNLYRFALHFHFDWMLLRRDLWTEQIDGIAKGEEERENMKNAILDFFRRTPKYTDDREKDCLDDFLKIYWTFNAFSSSLDNIAKTALGLIQGNPDALSKFDSPKNFLKLFDECRFKYSEMSKAVTNS